MFAKESISFIKHKKICKYFHYMGRRGAYDTPLFNILFWNRIKYIIKLLHEIELKFKVNFERVLDIGFNLGHFLLNFGINHPNTKIYGMDIRYTKNQEKKFIIKLFERFSLKLNLIVHDIQKKSNFSNDYFNLIVALDVLEHIENPQQALEEIDRILDKKGLLFISVPIESKILRFVKLIYKNTLKRNLNLKNHWQGKISSIHEFDKIVRRKFKVLNAINYPMKKLPLIFSYDIIYFIRKDLID